MEMRNDYCVGDLVYDAKLYDGLNDHQDDLAFYQSWFSSHRGTVLELCCGTGRLTIPLAASGVKIVGLDNNEAMLCEARRKAGEKRADVRFVEADMRFFALAETFSAIFIPFNSISQLYSKEDLFQTLLSARNHLKRNGHFLLDYFNPDIRYICENEKKRTRIAEYSAADGRNVVIDQTMAYESDTQINRIKWHYVIDGSEHSVVPLDMRMFFPQELDTYIESNGFRIVKKYGDFDQSVFQASSPRQIFVCKAV